MSTLSSIALPGTGDTFYPKQLQPEVFLPAAEGKIDLELRMQEGYDHSYFFIAYVVTLGMR